MTLKRILIGPTYLGFVDSEEDARHLIRTYMKSNLFRPSQQAEKQTLTSLIRSGHVLIYKGNEDGVDFWSDGDDWTFLGFDKSIRISRDSSTPTALMKKEFSMAVGGARYGLVAYHTEDDIAGSHTNDRLGLSYEHRLEPNMSRGPWEIIRLYPEDADSQVEIHELEEFTVYDIPYLQQQKYEGLELVITQSCFPGLREAVGHHCHIERLVDPTKPNSGEVNVYGFHTAKAMACDRFLNTAVEAIRTGRGQGPEWCYLDAAKLFGFEGRLKTMLRNKDMDEESIKEDENHVFLLRARI